MRLIERVDIWRRVQTTDDYGSLSTDEQRIGADIQCSIRPQIAEERVVNAKTSNVSTHKMVCRMTGLRGSDVVYRGATKYEVVAIVDETDGLSRITLECIV